MHLHAALLPPEPLAAAIAAAVAEVPLPVPEPEPQPMPATGAPSRRGLFARSRGPRVETAVAPPAPAEPAPQLDLVPADQLHLPLSSFGNLTTSEVDRLCRAITELAEGLAGVEVRIAGAMALEFPGDRAVWVSFDGDVDGLRAVFGGINQGVERLGFFLDRRTFRPWVPVGTINDATTAPYLEDVVAAIEGLRGQVWQVDAVSVMKRVLECRPPRSTELLRAPLGAAAS
ncbi:2'-5' RNA ligase family protein [Nocardioides ferulae]|uniref:2'-5' RNA ligase family protein n=1 Tax=Nocardioides ferulae TaxID=2340821 RepID=UPI000EB07039|nr:hypothetical protein [Nocardioides ferulae]